MAIAISSVAPLVAQVEMKPASASINPFTASLRIAADARAGMTGQFLDLQTPVAPLFAGRTVPDIAAKLDEVLELDAAARPHKLDTRAIAHELEVGGEVAVGFSARQIGLITGSRAKLRDDDQVVIVLAADQAERTVSVRRATMRNTRIYP